jgi:hypothetical protein
VGRFSDAALTAHRALLLTMQNNQQAQAEALKSKIALYEAHTPFRETCVSSDHP